MSTVRHNPAAIIVATLIYFFLGAAWFTTFMNPWLAGIGRTMAELKNSGSPPWLGYVVALVMTAILAIALSWIIQATGPQSAARGATIAAALWLGFVFTTWATEYAFEAQHPDTRYQYRLPSHRNAAHGSGARRMEVETARLVNCGPRVIVF